MDVFRLKRVVEIEPMLKSLFSYFLNRPPETARNRSDTAAEIGSTARSSPGLTPVRHGRPAPFPLHDGARWRVAHLLAKSPDWLKAAPMRENMRTSWRQSGQKKDYLPSLLNHNAKYKRL